MKDVAIRFLSGVLYISLIFVFLFLSREWFIGLIFVLALITLNEFLKLVSLKGVLAYLLLAATFYFLSYREINPSSVNIILGASILVNLFLLRDVLILNKLSLFKKRRYFCIIFYIICGFLFLSLIPSIGTENEFNPTILFGIFVLVWSNDTFAYLIGKNFGKRKLKESISPKKTVEGFIGGMVGAVVASIVVYLITEIYTLYIWLFLAIIVSVLGTIGDLIQSKFKRKAGVKDSGKLMPGHGGLYDRLDSIIYASPFIYTFLAIIDYVS